LTETTTDTTQATTNVTVTLTCRYAGQCSSEGKRCATCANNPAANYKQDHYIPKDYHPYQPWIIPYGIDGDNYQSK